MFPNNASEGFTGSGWAHRLRKGRNHAICWSHHEFALTRIVTTFQEGQQHLGLPLSRVSTAQPGQPTVLQQQVCVEV